MWFHTAVPVFLSKCGSILLFLFPLSKCGSILLFLFPLSKCGSILLFLFPLSKCGSILLFLFPFSKWWPESLSASCQRFLLNNLYTKETFVDDWSSENRVINVVLVWKYTEIPLAKRSYTYPGNY